MKEACSSSRSHAGIVVKLGGSVITDKRGDRPRIRRKVLDRLASELAEIPRGELRAVVHGAGSFGHGPVFRAGIHKGARTQSQRLAWAEIQVLQNELNAAVCRALQRAGLPATPCQASASAVLDRGRLQHLDDRAIGLLVEAKMLPVLFGVPAVDRSRGCAILSGDVLAPELAVRLGARQLVLGTDVDGVYTADPRQNPEATRFNRITPASWAVVERALTGAAGKDVTGGMRGKVAELLALVGNGISARIVDIRIPGRLLEAVRGKGVGTLIAADE